MIKNFEDINAWIFDLDDTLYPPESGIAEQFVKRITLFLMNEHNWDEEKAKEVQKKYYYRYGATLRGLMKHHEIENVKKFETFVHDVDFSNLKENMPLKEALSKLPGRKFVLTTSQNIYAKKVLDRIGILEEFEDVWGLSDTDYIAKPNQYAFFKLIKEKGLDIHKTALFEDSYKNIAKAKDLGMKTVWVNYDKKLGNCNSNSGDLKNLDMSIADIKTLDIVSTIIELSKK